MKLSRRSFMKANAVAAAAAAAGLSVPGVARAVVGQQEAIKWDKAPCRFCGTGCGVLVGTQQGRVVACQGDPDAPVNRGLNCIKGYFLPKIMYGKRPFNAADAAHERRQISQRRRVHPD